MDDETKKILNALQNEFPISQEPYREIAEKLDITEGTICRRVKQLIEDGSMQIVAIAKPHELGLHEAAMIGVTVQADQIDAVADKIAQLPEVTYLIQAAGEFDLFVEVYCRDRDHFVYFLNDRLQKIPGIERTQSFVILKMHKLSYRWGEVESPKIDHRPSIIT